MPLAPAPTGGGELAEDSEWRLPSGEDLISFALAAGIATCPLLDAVPMSESEAERPAAAAVRTVGGRAE